MSARSGRRLTIRNVSPRLAARLEEERRRSGASLNRTVLDLLERALGLAEKPFDNGLAALAGTWTEKDLAEFERHTASFSWVDGGSGS